MLPRQLQDGRVASWLLCGVGIARFSLVLVALRPIRKDMAVSHLLRHKIAWSEARNNTEANASEFDSESKFVPSDFRTLGVGAQNLTRTKTFVSRRE